jgi:DNA primase
VFEAVMVAGGCASGVSGPEWPGKVSVHVSNERIRSGVHALAVEPLQAGADTEERYARAILARMHEMVTGRQIIAIKSKLQRINPQEQPDDHARLFGELIALESYHRNLRERAIGDQ